ncbi:MAG: hypothetical protein QF495_10375, partial [SAR324 cluster bacterium]|nr:hypothetical protein [SAR324 cluster bacterium]
RLLTSPPSTTARVAFLLFACAHGLENGMVLTLEPGMQFGENKIMVHEENLVIREEGPQLLTRRAPEELPVIS